MIILENMRSTIKNQHGFSVIEILVILVFVIILGGIGWYVDSAKYSANGTQGRSASNNQGNITIKGTLESEYRPGVDQGMIYRIRTADGSIWSAGNCGFVNLPSARVDNVSIGDQVVVFGKLDKQQPHKIDLCGSSNYYIKR
ncbi:MAG TPA: hypothetical protein VGS08_05895 [Candidatus Saccharimonadales bacterium]|nr:hypothetical protein [Candidatus Saccharimonadales bacterium]